MESKVLIEELQFDLDEIQKDYQATQVMLKNNYEKVIKHIQVIEEMLYQNKENVENSILLNELYRKYQEQKKLINRRINESFQTDDPSKEESYEVLTCHVYKGPFFDDSKTGTDNLETTKRSSSSVEHNEAHTDDPDSRSSDEANLTVILKYTEEEVGSNRTASEAVTSTLHESSVDEFQDWVKHLNSSCNAGKRSSEIFYDSNSSSCVSGNASIFIASEFGEPLLSSTLCDEVREKSVVETSERDRDLDKSIDERKITQLANNELPPRSPLTQDNKLKPSSPANSDKKMQTDTTKISRNRIKAGKPYNFCDIDERHIIMDPNNNESEGRMLRPRPTNPPKK